MNEIRVSAVLLTTPAREALMVRKHGTTAFMQPGGKPEPGETPDVTAVREVREELGIELDPHTLTSIGQFASQAANERGFSLIADVFTATIERCDLNPAAEIAEAVWFTPESAAVADLAPLSRDLLLPRIWPEFTTATPLHS